MNPPEFAVICPVCGGRLDKMSDQPSRSLYACAECDCDLIIPTTAWEVARIKREQKWRVKPSTVSSLRRLFGAGVSIASGPGTRAKQPR